jgi:hypothetical protein
VKQISIFVLGFVTAMASAPAPAQDFTAGKTPAQLFRSDCAECHRSPNGLARNPDVRTLADFLREHYTTKSETASALATYVSGFAAGGTGARNRGIGVAAPPAAGERRPAERRGRGEGDATANGDDARTNARPVEDLGGRHRRTTIPSSDGDKRRVRDDGEVPRPPGSIATTPAASKSNARTQESAPGGTTDPISRLRSYLSSGLGSESAILEAAKTGTPKVHKRRNHADDAESPAHDAQATAKSATDALPIAPPSATIDAAAPGRQPPEGSVSPAPAPTVPPAVTSPRLEQ